MISPPAQRAGPPHAAVDDGDERRHEHGPDEQRVEQDAEPTMIPICPSAMSGSTPSTVNTAASRIPALVMTPPVTATARTMPAVVP
ncbi:MAG TPA: hypothetical protein VHM65_10525, partial [Candidatus Lustribacter sp.]|nr:hypothetical protein [Candidatus Lustribacter sp.]